MRVEIIAYRCHVVLMVGFQDIPHTQLAKCRNKVFINFQTLLRFSCEIITWYITLFSPHNSFSMSTFTEKDKLEVDCSLCNFGLQYMLIISRFYFHDIPDSLGLHVYIIRLYNNKGHLIGNTFLIWLNLYKIDNSLSGYYPISLIHFCITHTDYDQIIESRKSIELKHFSSYEWVIQTNTNCVQEFLSQSD